jgi:dynein heavy chain
MACVILAAIAGKELQLAEDVFKLQHLLDCHLLQHREEVEEITTAAVKEEQIETKLASIEADWVTMNLVRVWLEMGGST